MLPKVQLTAHISSPKIIFIYHLKSLQTIGIAHMSAHLGLVRLSINVLMCTLRPQMRKRHKNQDIIMQTKYVIDIIIT